MICRPLSQQADANSATAQLNRVGEIEGVSSSILSACGRIQDMIRSAAQLRGRLLGPWAEAADEEPAACEASSPGQCYVLRRQSHDLHNQLDALNEHLSALSQSL